MKISLCSRTSEVATVAVVAAMLAALTSAAPAAAAEPWWHVNTVSAPAAQPGGVEEVLLEVSNLGDAAVDGAVHPVSIVDRLPAGVTPTHVQGGGGGSFVIGVNDVPKLIKCEISGQVVSCMYPGPLLAYERFMIPITVKVQPGDGEGVSEVSVTGGGAPPVRWRRALGMRESPGPYGPESYELTPEEEGGAPATQAGEHPFQLTSTLSFHSQMELTGEGGGIAEEPTQLIPVGLTRDLRFTLPPGLVGNPTPLPKCPLAVFVKQANLCPNDTAIGVATPIVTDAITNKEHHVPYAVTVPLYNVEPSVGEPARFGFVTEAGPVVLDTSVPPNGGAYPVVVTVPDVPDNIGFVGAQVTFWGVPGESAHDTARGSCLDQYKYEGFATNITQFELACPVQEKPQPFLIMPTSCLAPPSTTLEGDSWERIGVFAKPIEYVFASVEGDPLAEDGCNHLSIEPSISVTPDGQQASTPTGLEVDVHVDQEAGLVASGLAQATVKDTTVALPAGVVLNPSSADGLQACTTAEIALDSEARQTCPESSKVALVEVRTPLLPNPLKGAAYLAAQEANPFDSLIALYVEVYDPVSGVRVKLDGEVKANPLTGQLVATFDETPQLPFEDFIVEFFGGSRAPLGTPAQCGAYTTTGSIFAWSGNPASQLVSPPFEISAGPTTPGHRGGTPCPGTSLPFQPYSTGGALNLQAGAFSPFTTTLSRESGEQNLQSAEVTLPPGISGLLSSVELCREPQANLGTCPPNSQIGETTVSVGLGGNPYTVTGGRVYLTGPYNGSRECAVGETGCAPFGLTVVNPAKAGPFDLAKTKENHPACDCVLVRAKVAINPITSALTITSDPPGSPYAIPTIIEGIPLQIQHVNITTTRRAFQFNPTNCNKMEVQATLHSAEGGVDQLKVPFQVTNCAALAFKPSFTVSTSGKTSRARGASLHVKLVYPNAPFGSQANIASVKVDLPKQLPSRLTTLQKACVDRVFEVNPANCPAASRVGSAKAITPILSVPLEGPAYFVSHGGAKFPELIVVLQGYGVRIDLHGETFINKEGITSSTFHTVPDQPVGSFELTLPEGSDSALSANGNFCSTGRSVLVKKRVKFRSKGHTRTVTRTIRETAAGMVMPTAFTAQNGAVIHTNTPITVTECGPKSKKKSKASQSRKHNKK